jgi:chromosome segregation ATPase
MPDRPRLVPTLAALLAIAACPVVVAQGAGAASGEGYMSRAAVRECAQIEADLEALASELQNRSGEVDAAESQYLHLERSLDEAERQLDRSDAEAVSRYNAQVRQYSERLDSYNRLLPAHAAIVARHNALVQAFNERCTQQEYLIRDQIDARATLERPDDRD